MSSQQIESLQQQVEQAQQTANLAICIGILLVLAAIIFGVWFWCALLSPEPNKAERWGHG